VVSVASASQVALAAGLPPRYFYWQGHSSRRYLFTATEPSIVGDFEEGVVIAVAGGRIIWSGEITELAEKALCSRLGGAAFYVHLLAATPAERRAIIYDLRPLGREGLPLAA
jgi:hypothetical protein